MTANLLTLAVAAMQVALVQEAVSEAVTLEPARMVVVVVQGKAAPLLG